MISSRAHPVRYLTCPYLSYRYLTCPYLSLLDLDLIDICPARYLDLRAIFDLDLSLLRKRRRNYRRQVGKLFHSAAPELLNSCSSCTL